MHWVTIAQCEVLSTTAIVLYSLLSYSKDVEGGKKALGIFYKLNKRALYV